jgi:hypothetical protein
MVMGIPSSTKNLTFAIARSFPKHNGGSIKKIWHWLQPLPQRMNWVWVGVERLSVSIRGYLPPHNFTVSPHPIKHIFLQQAFWVLVCPLFLRICRDRPYFGLSLAII